MNHRRSYAISSLSSSRGMYCSFVSCFLYFPFFVYCFWFSLLPVFFSFLRFFLPLCVLFVSFSSFFFCFSRQETERMMNHFNLFLISRAHLTPHHPPPPPIPLPPHPALLRPFPPSPPPSPPPPL